MAEKRPIQDLMGVTMEKMREMVDVQTIIGDPIVVSDKVTIVPVSKVSYGFASGGSDLPVKTNPKDLFGGGAGAGVSIQPVAFLVVQEDGVRLLQMDEGSDALSSAIRSVPEVVDRLAQTSGSRCVKSAVTTAFLQPVRTMSRVTRCPRTAWIPCSRIDFPAPVSPVNMFSFLPNSTSISSIKARFFTCKYCNMHPPIR